MEDVNDTSKDIRNGFICGAWRLIQQYEGAYVMRCDRPDGHKGYHVDKVLLTNWEGLTPKQTQDKERGIRKGSWVCNQCGSPEFTGSVSEDDFADDAMSCTSCGGTEFHWVA